MGAMSANSDGKEMSSLQAPPPHLEDLSPPKPPSRPSSASRLMRTAPALPMLSPGFDSPATQQARVDPAAPTDEKVNDIDQSNGLPVGTNPRRKRAAQTASSGGNLLKSMREP